MEINTKSIIMSMLSQTQTGQQGGVSYMLLSIINAVMVNILSYYICKWLDEKIQCQLA